MQNQAPVKSRHTSLAYAALIAGFIAMLSDFYYMQVLSYSVGLVKGITSMITAYNITPSNTLIASLSGSSALAIAVHITYIMLPFALIIFAIGAVWLLGRQSYRVLSVGMLFSSIIFGMLLGVLNADFYLGPLIGLGPFAGVALGVAAGAIGFSDSSRRHGSYSLRPISINPETPYSNMLVLSSRFFSKLSGDISILDMHFDDKAMENLLMLMEGHVQEHSLLRILTGTSRLGSHFHRNYFDFKEELSNKGISLELRVMPGNDAQQQHERLIIDSKNAYKIPPMNIINRKSEHIVSINRSEAVSRFEDIWQRSTKYENL
ncbi:hypothetical protein M1373_03605 [Candidatus Marsarchaeota archaeon]|nr:hypothetical protein [Candidatus Marsarchaeota archaeon]MCL5405005.1 hypothetical protein [Candidatus Marsarchaeota archaeon]